MKKDTIVFSRIAFCSHCYQNKSPSKGDKVLIWHSTAGAVVIHYISGVKGTWGFVPHLFIVDIPIPKDVAEIQVHAVCGICDVEISDELNKRGRYDYVITHERIMMLSRRDYLALWKHWKNTGLEID